MAYNEEKEAGLADWLISLGAFGMVMPFFGLTAGTGSCFVAGAIAIPVGLAIKCVENCADLYAEKSHPAPSKFAPSPKQSTNTPPKRVTNMPVLPPTHHKPIKHKR